MNTKVEEPTPSTPTVAPNLGSVLWDSAWSAVTKGFIVLLFGSIAIAIVGSIAGRMTPSTPPGFAAESETLKGLFSSTQGLRSWLKAHAFIILSSVFFILEVRARMAPPALENSPAETSCRTAKIGRRISKDWFGSIVGNAFGALVLASIIVLVQNLSWTKWIFDWVLGALKSVILPIADRLLGAERVDSITGWYGWYGQNQLRFTFWILYIAAICDDFGIPNLKTLGRWLLRRYRSRGGRYPCPP